MKQRDQVSEERRQGRGIPEERPECSLGRSSESIGLLQLIWPWSLEGAPSYFMGGSSGKDSVCPEFHRIGRNNPIGWVHRVLIVPIPAAGGMTCKTMAKGWSSHQRWESWPLEAARCLGVAASWVFPRVCGVTLPFSSCLWILTQERTQLHRLLVSEYFPSALEPDG